MELNYFLGAVAYPVLAVCAALVVVRAFRSRAPWCGSPAIVALALAGVVVAASVQQSGNGVAWPHVSFDWFPWAVVLAALLGSVLEIRWGKHGMLPARRTADIAICAAAVPFVLVAPAGLDGGLRIAAVLLAGVSTTACLHAVLALRAREAQSAIGMAMFGSAGFLSYLVFMSNFASLSLILGAFSTAAAVITVLGQIQKPLALGASTVVVWCVVLSAAAAYALANDSSGIPQVSWFLAAASPVSCLLAAAPIVARKPRLATAICAAAPIACAATAVAVALVLSADTSIRA